MMADGTKVDHNKRDIDDQKKETKALTADRGSEDEFWERGNVGMTGGEPDAGNNGDKVKGVVAKMKVTRMTDDKVNEMIARIQEAGDAMKSD